MVYRAIGAIVHSAGLSVVFAEFHENAGKWTFELKADHNYTAGDPGFLLNDFIEEKGLQYKVALITVHAESAGVILNGADIAAKTSLPVITDLTSLDIALGGNGEFFNSSLQKLGIDNKDMNEKDKAICVAFMGILRWREEYNFLSSLTGASRSSIGGAVWLGQEA